MAGVPVATRNLIWDRDSYECRRCYRIGEQIHHRHARQMGGTRRPWVNQPANLVLLCASCHAWIESHRALAEERGWLVREGTDPATVPLLTVWGDIFLDNKGGVRDAVGSDRW